MLEIISITFKIQQNLFFSFSEKSVFLKRVGFHLQSFLNLKDKRFKLI